MTGSEKRGAKLTADMHPFLEGFPEGFLAAASENLRDRTFETEEVVFQEGHRAEHFYLILNGKVALEIGAPDHPRITVQTVGTREVLGWAWLVPPYRWPVDARAVKPTQALELDAFVLHRYFKLHPDIGYKFLLRLLPVIAGRLDETRMQLVDIHGV
jgi:CRP-like cAMP-binding protein